MGPAEKQLWQIIAHYLHKHSELCLAGMGRFAAGDAECKVDPVAKIIQPVSRTVFFQSGEWETTPEFIDFVKAVLGNPDLDVASKLVQFVKLFLSGIKEKGRLEIEGFGTFRTNVMGEPEFEQISSLTFRDESYGLKPVHFAANLVKTKRITVDKTDEDEDPELTQMRESALKELKVMLDQARVAEASKEKKSSMLFPVIATVLILILLANLGFFLFKGPVDELKNQVSKMDLLGKTAEMIDSQSATPKPMAPQPVVSELKSGIEAPEEKNADSIAVHIGSAYKMDFIEFDSTLYNTAEPAVATAVQPDVSLTPQEEVTGTINTSGSTLEEGVTDLPNMVNVDAAENGIEKGFYVVAGAFRNPVNANRFADRLQKGGDSGALVIKPSSHPLYLVAYAKGKTLNQALNLLEAKQQQRPSVWVYCAY